MTLNPHDILPVPCPQCGEAQNTATGEFDPAAEPFGPIGCMVCGHAFEADDYRRRLAERQGRMPPLRHSDTGAQGPG